jgi:hypothetical protein
VGLRIEDVPLGGTWHVEENTVISVLFMTEPCACIITGHPDLFEPRGREMVLQYTLQAEPAVRGPFVGCQPYGRETGNESEALASGSGAHIENFISIIQLEQQGRPVAGFIEVVNRGLVAWAVSVKGMIGRLPQQSLPENRPAAVEEVGVKFIETNAVLVFFPHSLIPGNRIE